MLNLFIEHIKSTNLFSKEDKLLLAISGGRDSMVMLDLFVKSNFNVFVAHCNFNLRDKESDLDEQFVREIAKKNNLPYYHKSFKTKEFSEQNKLSTQMAARELRYGWFEDIRIENSIQFVATAHHKNDVAETILINLTKGTGLSGLHGIRQKNDTLIRPLLCFSREQIDQYVVENIIQYREDQSNKETKYTRNSIRHNVIPELEKINPSVIKTLNDTANRLFDVEKIVKDKIEEEFNNCCQKEGDKMLFNIKLLQQLNPLSTYLYYFFKDYGFNSTDVNDIISSFNSLSGKEFCSTNFQILKDREFLILVRKEIKKEEEFIINSAHEFEEKLNITVGVKSNSEILEIVKKSNYAYLDIEKLIFPLKIRKWKDGDSFQPFGMKGKKKLSDFFIDQRLSIIEKQETWILTCKKEIVWVIGHRISDRFKVTNKTKEVLVLNYNPLP